MDHASFDRLTRTMGAIGSRRAAVGALLGTGLAGTLGIADAAKKNRNKKRRSDRKGKTAQVSAQAADCLSISHSSNVSGCNYNGANFSGQLLHSSRMVETTFVNATLINTDLSSSNLKNADFRNANLCDADISSSTLRGTDFRNANLTRADLHSSTCNGVIFNANTKFCQTIDCQGNLRNDDCVGLVCCTNAECPIFAPFCLNSQCVGL